jgi:plastocyanin
MSMQRRKLWFGFVIVVVMALTLALAATACGDDEAKGNSSQTATSSVRTRTPGSQTSTLAAGSRTPSTTSSAGASTAEINMVPTLKFDKTSLTIAANKDVKVSVDNTDTGMEHNFGVYKSKEDATADQPALAETKPCTAPCQETVTLNLDPGEYFFHCDIHPTKMTGTITAQ